METKTMSLPRLLRAPTAKISSKSEKTVDPKLIHDSREIALKKEKILNRFFINDGDETELKVSDNKTNITHL